MITFHENNQARREECGKFNSHLLYDAHAAKDIRHPIIYVIYHKNYMYENKEKWLFNDEKISCHRYRLKKTIAKY